MKIQTTSNKSNEPFYIDKKIKKQLLKGQEAIKVAGQDRIYLITGKEGAGKSLLAIQCGWFVDNNINIDDITMTPEEFSNKVINTKKKVVIGDEIFAGLSSKGALSKENKKLVRLLIECRQRGLTIFLCIPSIFLLEKYVAIFRSHALFNVQISRKSYTNRFYKVYNYKNKKLLYMLGHKYMSYSKPIIYKKHRFYGNFPPTITKEEYESKKSITFKGKKEKENQEENNITYERNILLKYLHNTKKMPYKSMIELFGEYNISITKSAISIATRNLPKYGKS